MTRYLADTNILLRSSEPAHLLTFNVGDFKRFHDIITVVLPDDVLRPPSVNP